MDGNNDINNIHDSESMDYEEFLKFTLDTCRKRIDDMMKWVNDVERKASTLIAANGVIIALSVTLLGFLSQLYNTIVVDNTVCFIPDGFLLVLVVLAYVAQMILFVCSIIFARLGHGISDYPVPDINYLGEYCKKPFSLSREFVYGTEVSSCLSSNEVILKELKKKAKNVRISQILFVVGCIVLASLLVLSVTSICLGLIIEG